MEINYELILKYLAPQVKSVKTNFESKKHIMNYSDKFPIKFQEILGDKFYRYGISQLNTENDNISFYSSLFTLLTNEYITMDKKEEENYINTFIKDLESETKKLPSSLKQISKGALKNYIKDKKPCIWLLELLAHKFEINILIFDFVTLDITTVYFNDTLNPWHSFLLFAKYEEKWEPIRNHDKKIYSYNDSIIKKCLSNPLKYYCEKIIKKEFNLLDNLKEVINSEFKMTEINNIISEVSPDTDCLIDNNVFDENMTFIKKDEIIKLNKAKLNKMTKDNIISYIKSLKNVTINVKATKKDLIELAITV